MSRRSGHATTGNSGAGADPLRGCCADGGSRVIRSTGNVRERVGVGGADRELAVDGDVTAGSSLSDRFLRAGRLQMLTLVAVFIPVVGKIETLFLVIRHWVRSGKT